MSMFTEAAQYSRYMQYTQDDDYDPDAERICVDCDGVIVPCDHCKGSFCDCEPCDCAFVDDRPTPEAE